MSPHANSCKLFFDECRVNRRFPGGKRQCVNRIFWESEANGPKKHDTTKISCGSLVPFSVLLVSTVRLMNIPSAGGLRHLQAKLAIFGWLSQVILDPLLHLLHNISI